MTDARQELKSGPDIVARLRERERDLRAACEYVGGGVKGVIFAEVAENTKEAADEIERLRRALKEIATQPGEWREWNGHGGGIVYDYHALVAKAALGDETLDGPWDEYR